MSVFGDVGIAAAARLERSLGPTVGLRAYRKLFSDDDASVRAAAVLAAVRCARVLGDAAAIAASAQCWRTLRGDHRGMSDVVRALVVEGRQDWATDLAEAEAHRRRDGRGHYLVARVHLAFGRTSDALDAFDRAARLGDARLKATAAIMRLRHGQLGDAQAVALARTVDLEASTRPQRAWVADALLHAPSPFIRAKGLSILGDLAEVPDALGRWAIERAARHADGAGARLTWVEADRIAVAVGRHPDEDARSAAGAALEALRRLDPEGTEVDAHRALLQSWPNGDRYVELVDALQQGLEVHPEVLNLEPRHPLHAATLSLSVVAALKRSEPDAAATHLQALGEGEARGRLPAPVWTAWLWAASHRDADLRALALKQLRRALARPTSPPPRGYLSLEPALRRGGDGDEILDILRRATARGEPGACEMLVRELATRGWASHAEGDRHQAAAWLREAKLLS